MSTTANALYLPVGGHLVPLDLDPETQLLPTFQANDRTRPESIQSDFSPEFSVPGTAHNHRLLRHAAGSQPLKGAAYVRLPCVLTSGGVEILPLGLLYVKGYQEGKYQLQLSGGNRRLVEAVGDKTLADLDLSRFDHAWTPANILAGLPFDAWQTQGWGYEVYDRGKPLDWQAVDPYTLYPSCSFDLVLRQLLADAGFAATSLDKELFYGALNVPSANPHTYSEDFRGVRELKAGYFYQNDPVNRTFIYHDSTFGPELLNFSYVSRKPYHAPELGKTGATYFAGRYTVDTLGYYDIQAAIPCWFGVNHSLPGKARVKFMLQVNGQSVFAPNGGELGKDEKDTGNDPVVTTFRPELNNYLLKPGDYVELWWLGTELPAAGLGPDQPRWGIGPWGSQVTLPGGGYTLAAEVSFSVVLKPDFPPGGLVKLNEWLPEMKQLDFLKAAMLLLSLTIETDPYTPFLSLTPGNQTLQNVGKALNWTNKRDSFARPGRLQERELAYRLGEYTQRNYLKWTEDENVLAGYGDGLVTVADEVLDKEHDIATLPFAATETSAEVPGLLRILNFEPQDLAATPITYSKVEAKPRLTLRSPDAELSGRLITVPEIGKPGDAGYQAPAYAPFTSTSSYFVGVDLSLDLNQTVLETYWKDVRATLDETRVIRERIRLTARDITALKFNTPVWLLEDYWLVSRIEEFDARRSTVVQLVRLNAKFLPPPVVPGEGVEFWSGEFWEREWY